MILSCEEIRVLSLQFKRKRQTKTNKDKNKTNVSHKYRPRVKSYVTRIPVCFKLQNLHHEKDSVHDKDLGVFFRILSGNFEPVGAI